MHCITSQLPTQSPLQCIQSSSSVTYRRGHIQHYHDILCLHRICKFNNTQLKKQLCNSGQQPFHKLYTFYTGTYRGFSYTTTNITYLIAMLTKSMYQSGLSFKSIMQLSCHLDSPTTKVTSCNSVIVYSLYNSCLYNSSLPISFCIIQLFKTTQSLSVVSLFLVHHACIHCLKKIQSVQLCHGNLQLPLFIVRAHKCSY